MQYSVFESFCSELGLDVKRNEPMCKHTSFKTGGAADIFINIGCASVLSTLLETAKALCVPVTVIGKGSNLLVSDRGIEGAVINLSDMDEISVEEDTITAGAGASLSALCVAAANAGLSGLEFAYGIPGSVGGALYMNAGAYGGEISQVAVSAEYVTLSGQTGIIEKKDMQLGYRTSIFKTAGDIIITKAVFRLKKGDSKEIWNKMNEYMEKRKLSQPLEFPSAGSTFKRPKGHFAGTLIEQNNLKGVSVGGAAVSQKHAGFIINTGGATTDDILKLIELVKSTVQKNNGVLLEPEVIFVGRN
ncbi:MAG: UDP-N-acetylmuramate dehydrogenase [Acutalibacteraceae bacterium]|jgi:UDP-N-acetylmuramate dehydrogenase